MTLVLLEPKVTLVQVAHKVFKEPKVLLGLELKAMLAQPVHKVMQV